MFKIKITRKALKKENECLRELNTDLKEENEKLKKIILETESDIHICDGLCQGCRHLIEVEGYYNHYGAMYPKYECSLNRKCKDFDDSVDLREVRKVNCPECGVLFEVKDSGKKVEYLKVILKRNKGQGDLKDTIGIRTRINGSLFGKIIELETNDEVEIVSAINKAIDSLLD